MPVDLEAGLLFVIVVLATGLLNPAGQDAWSWLRGRIARRRGRG